MDIRKRKKVELKEKSAIEIYEMVLDNNISRFPPDFWDKQTAKKIVRYIYKGVKKEVLLKTNFRNELTQKRVIGAYEVFNYSKYFLLIYCFPQYKIKPWELERVPEGCWADKENVKQAVRYMLLKKEKVKSKEQICEIFSADLLRKHGLKSIFEEYSLHEILQISFPEFDIYESDLKKIDYWTDESAKRNIKHMIEDVLKWDVQEVCNSISTQIFYNHGLRNLLKNKFDNSIYKALNFVYPGVYTKNNLKAYRYRSKD